MGTNASFKRIIGGRLSSDLSRGIAASVGGIAQGCCSRAVGRMGEDCRGGEHRRFHYWRRKCLQRANVATYVQPGSDAGSGAAASSPGGGATIPRRASVRAEATGCGRTGQQCGRLDAAGIPAHGAELGEWRRPATITTSRPLQPGRRVCGAENPCRDVGGRPAYVNSATGRQWPELQRGSPLKGESGLHGVVMKPSPQHQAYQQYPQHQYRITARRAAVKHRGRNKGQLP